MSQNVVAIIPARGGSTGIPRKNLKIVAGKPLVGHAVEQSLASQCITRTIVSSEDPEIQRVAREFGAEVLDRPEDFHHDNTFQEVDRLLKWTVLDIESRNEHVDVVVLLYPTAPLREVATIDEAVRLVTEAGYDSALSLYEDKTYLWRVDGETAEPTNYDPAKRGPRQKESWNQWAENKAVYVMTRDLLVNTGCRLGGKIGHVEMPQWRSVDVDSLRDLGLVRILMEQQQRNQIPFGEMIERAAT